MAIIKDSIDVNVPAALAYAYWSRFEDLPKFMENVEEVHQYSPGHMHWKAKIAGKEEEWDAEVTENILSRRISWASTSGAKNNGTVAFEPVAPTVARVELAMDYEPQGITEKVGNVIGMDRRSVHKDLENFKHYAENRSSMPT